MFGKEKKIYDVSYTTDSGSKETAQMDTEDLRRLVKQESDGAKFSVGKDGRVTADYKLKIDNIRTSYLSGRDVEFFAPGISRAEKYTDNIYGYFIKDTRSNFKALAPGTNDILIFSSNEEAKNYFKEHRAEIEADYVAQKDSYFDLNNVIYRSITYAYDNDKYAMNLSGKGNMFPEDNLYTFEDIENLKRVVGSYEDFNASHEYAQNLKFIRPTFSDFVTKNAIVTKDDMVRLDLDSFDPDFKATMQHYVKSYPERVNQDVIIAEQNDISLKQARDKLASSQQSADSAAEAHGLVHNEQPQAENDVELQ